tara:strand:+ start:365 stop:634 length:270 start_codon:yes stop_codon:yes gene_type:complete
MTKLSRIEFNATPEERKRLDIEAAAHGMSRQELIRERVLLRTPDTPKFRTDKGAIDRAIDAVTRQYHCIPRHQLEPIVCTVICALTAEG